MKIIKNYMISTGEKKEFYTLWKETIVMYSAKERYTHFDFIQNLSMTKEGAIAKAKELGIELTEEDFFFNLKQKPTLTAFGIKFTFKNNKWYGKANEAFFKCWKVNKKDMKTNGWSCWLFNGIWYAGLKTN